MGRSERASTGAEGHAPGNIRTRPREEWIRILRETDVPCAPVLSRMEFIDHPQVDALAMRRAIDDPTLGATIQPGIPVGLELTPGEIAGPAPAIKDDPDVEDGSPSPRRGRKATRRARANSLAARSMAC